MKRALLPFSSVHKVFPIASSWNEGQDEENLATRIVHFESCETVVLLNHSPRFVHNV
jgi:hypothetical protein